ncbi:tyrosine-type recombinase/integrase [Hymenobacter sp. CRA2]|uniref:tyrosine-type recombinase/integrase n=1 Tax=Hymenobacter sp. CRA2 TaxID=1955620 RepID=UPI00098F0160|nr:site-specific integrase [Hymenobacter sp. CRA2]OON65491.1 hypothetical protein B0919_24000 [Hymenobacter sp. CRA2]
MKFSAKIVLRQPARKDGTCLIRLQVILDRKVVPIGLDVFWHPALFDEAQGVCLTELPVAQRKADYKKVLAVVTAWAGGSKAALEKQASDINLVIGRAKANEIFISYRLDESGLNAETFLLAYNTEASRNDFLDYMEKKIEYRFRKGKGHRHGISENTRKNHTSTLNALRAFRPRLPFFLLSPKLIDDYHEFLRRRIKSINTIWGRHKDVKTYLEFARKEKIKFEDPYEDFDNKSAPGQWKPLRTAEFRALEEHYRTLKPGTSRRRVLQKFLFSCNSSLRLGDLKAIQHARFDGAEMVFKIQKTYEDKMRDMMLPLTRKAIRYLEDSRIENGVEGFYNYTDQASNRILKKIGAELGITTRMHHHVGRETFGTEFIRRGGKVEVLQKLMDHSKITTTMKYVHVDDDMKRDAIRMLDEQDENYPMMMVS